MCVCQGMCSSVCVCGDGGGGGREYNLKDGKGELLSKDQLEIEFGNYVTSVIQWFDVR